MNISETESQENLTRRLDMEEVAGIVEDILLIKLKSVEKTCSGSFKSAPDLSASEEPGAWSAH